MCGIEWAAGLFTGEGTAGQHKNSGFYISLGMQDEEAVTRFAEILTAYMPLLKPKAVPVTCDSAGMYRIHLSGARARAAYTAMEPYLTNAKGGK